VWQERTCKAATVVKFRTKGARRAAGVRQKDEQEKDIKKDEHPKFAMAWRLAGSENSHNL